MFLLSTGSLYLYGVRRVFELAAETGYDGIEMLIDHRPDTWQLAYLEKLSSTYNLKIASLHSPFALQLPFWPKNEGSRIERTVSMAEKLNASTAVVHLPTRWPYSILTNSRQRLMIPHFGKANTKDIAWFEQQLPFIQAETTVRIAVEIMPIHRIFRWPVNAYVWNTVSEWIRFDNLTLDTTHCGTWGVDPIQVFDRAEGRVKHIHISNLAGRKEHQLPAKGKLALDKFLRHAAAGGYSGHIVVETCPEAMEADSIDRVKQNLIDSLAFCREHFR